MIRKKCCCSCGSACPTGSDESCHCVDIDGDSTDATPLFIRCAVSGVVDGCFQAFDSGHSPFCPGDNRCTIAASAVNNLIELEFISDGDGCRWEKVFSPSPINPVYTASDCTTPASWTSTSAGNTLTYRLEKLTTGIWLFRIILTVAQNFPQLGFGACANNTFYELVRGEFTTSSTCCNFQLAMDLFTASTFLVSPSDLGGAACFAPCKDQPVCAGELTIVEVTATCSNTVIIRFDKYVYLDDSPGARTAFNIAGHYLLQGTAVQISLTEVEVDVDSYTPAGFDSWAATGQLEWVSGWVTAINSGAVVGVPC